MTIRHLRIFIAVAETGKMGLAAKQLYIAQPTVSQVIADMEKSYGVKLFERLSKKLYITPQGERLLSYARHIVSLFDEMERSMRNSSAQVLLRVGATITVGACVLSPIIRRYEELFPLSQVQVFVDNTRLIEEMLLESQLDVALVEGSVESPDLCTLPVIEDELVLACAPDHPFAFRETLHPEELEGQNFVLREKGSGTRALFEDYLHARQIEVCPKWVCHSADSILSAVEAGQGLTVISRLLAQPRAAEGRLRLLRLADARLTRSFRLVYHKNKYLSEPLRHLMDCMQQVAGTPEDYLGS